MAKFSLGLEDEGGGPSTSRSKRSRTCLFYPETASQNDGVQSQSDHETDKDQPQDDDEDEDSQNDDEEEELEEEYPVEESTTARVRPSRNGSVSLTLTDPEVFDCNICYEPLTIPVFQCENGHTACSCCCKRIANKCPSCSLPIGYNRCRAIEKVLESVKLPCQNSTYGCKEMITYSKKSEHDKICAYIPCKCPISGCSFLASSKQLCLHVKYKHVGSAISFSYDCTFPVFFTKDSRFLVLQEEKEGILFILNNISQDHGNMIMVCCMESSSAKGRYLYELTAKSGESKLKFESFTKNIQCKLDNPLSAGFLFVPSGFFGSYGQITLDLQIWRFSASAPII